MIDQVYGDEIEVGDEIGPLIKQPDLEQVRAFLSAWRRRDADVPHRFTDPTAAVRDGLAGPVIPGPMSLAFLSQLLTDWAGPAGRLKTLDVNYRRSTRHGEVLKCIGLVTDKRDEGAETVIHLDVYTEDPRGDRPTQGVAEVRIPTTSA